MSKLILAIILAVFANTSYASICSMKLQEEANVFQVSCLANTSMCMVTGFFTHPKLIPGFSGVVATFQPTPEKMKRDGSKLMINTFRHTEPKIETPKGYFSAMESAEKMVLGELQSQLIYFDARTGEVAPKPELKCE